MEKHPFGRGFVHIFQNHCFVQNKRMPDGTVRYKCRTDTCPVRLNVLPGGQPEYGMHGSQHEDHDDLTFIEQIRTRTDAIETAKTRHPLTGKRPAMSEAYQLACHRTKERNLGLGFNPAEVASMVPEFVTIKTPMQVARQENYPSNPLTRAEVCVEAPYDKTLAGELFLQTSNVTSPEKMLIFATDDFLVKLACCDELFMDGTFYACPLVFKQLYTIHALVNNQMFCLVYALLPGFSAEVYKDLFRFLQDRIYTLGQTRGLNITFSPKKVTCDFETATIGALQTVFPDIQVSGCHFHYCQCLWRQMQKKHLQERYKIKDPVEVPLRRMFKRLCALSLLPQSEVTESYTTIVQQAMEHYHADNHVSDFFAYFESQWMSDIGKWNHYPHSFPPETFLLFEFVSLSKRHLNQR